jgi:hypothetical protein
LERSKVRCGFFDFLKCEDGKTGLIVLDLDLAEKFEESDGDRSLDVIIMGRVLNVLDVLDNFDNFDKFVGLICSVGLNELIEFVCFILIEGIAKFVGRLDVLFK